MDITRLAIEKNRITATVLLILLVAGLAILAPHDLFAGAYWANAAGLIAVAALWALQRRNVAA